MVRGDDIIHKHCHFSYWYLTPLILCLTLLTISSLFFFFLDVSGFPKSLLFLRLLYFSCLFLVYDCMSSFLFDSPLFIFFLFFTCFCSLSILVYLLPPLTSSSSSTSLLPSSHLCLLCGTGQLFWLQTVGWLLFSTHRIIFFLLQHNVVLSSLFRASRPIWQGGYLTGKEREHVGISLHLGWLAVCTDWSVSNILKIILTMRSSATTSQTAQTLEMLVRYLSPKDSISPCLWAQPLEF